MKPFIPCALAGVLSAAAWVTSSAPFPGFQPPQSAPPPGSDQPPSTNPMPRRTDPPPASSPMPRRTDPLPRNPGTQPPTRNPPIPQTPGPGQQQQPDGTNQPVTRDPNDPNLTPEELEVLRRAGLRPFAFATPNSEAGFITTAQRLVRMEQKLERTNLANLKRLGEIRSLAPARQNEALFDLLQQMLQDRIELQRYLVAARAAWAGEIELAEEAAAATELAR